MHSDALQTLVKAPLSFFTSTDTGVITNLFSQDLNLVDTELPNALLNFLFAVSTSARCTSVFSSTDLTMRSRFQLSDKQL